jgi:hypothetical protein
MTSKQIDATQIVIDPKGPPGSHGFRRGEWQFRYNGRQYQFYCSVPHAMELADQERLLQQRAAQWLERDQ